MFLNDTSYLKEMLMFIMGCCIYKTVCTSCNGKDVKQWNQLLFFAEKKDLKVFKKKNLAYCAKTYRNLE